MGDVMPVRNSTNPVEGINRCECGQVRTITAHGENAPSTCIRFVMTAVPTNKPALFGKTALKPISRRLKPSSKANKPVIPWLVNPKLIPNRLRTLSQKNPKASLKKHRKHCQTQAIKAAIVRQQELKRQREQAELNQASQPKPKKSRAHGKLSWLASLLGL